LQVHIQLKACNDFNYHFLMLGTLLLFISVSRLYEPELICERKSGQLKRCPFWAAGANDIIAVDQHDKWKQFEGWTTKVQFFNLEQARNIIYPTIISL
jgi:hypothetical protein